MLKKEKGLQQDTAEHRSIILVGHQATKPVTILTCKNTCNLPLHNVMEYIWKKET